MRWQTCWKRIACSFENLYSVASAASVGSTASIFAVVSSAGVLSIFAVASCLSILSVASVLSLLSSESVLSVASTNCFIEFYKKCEPPTIHPIDTKFEVRLLPEVWDEMEKCSKAEYKSADRPSKCDYQTAVCSFANLTSGYNVTDSCKVRRKGSSTWRDMDDKPSFKIKKFGDGVQFGSFECGSNCPPGHEHNIWSSNKVTLQNQVMGDGEIDAYNLFRQFVAAPLATQTTVNVYRGDALKRTDTYVLLETIDDKHFLRKWWGETAVLYELDNDSNPHIAKFERYIEAENEISQQFANLTRVSADCEQDSFRISNGYDDRSDCESDETEKAAENVLSTESHLASMVHLGLEQMDRTNLLHYYAGVVATEHWDATCRYQNSNTYVVFNGSTHFYVPSGTDETFQCPHRQKWYHWFGAKRDDGCPSMKQCLADLVCQNEHEMVQAKVDGCKQRDPYDACPDLVEITLWSVLTPVCVTLAGMFVMYLVVRCSPSEYRPVQRTKPTEVFF